jgi:FkbM family methyltransferase
VYLEDVLPKRKGARASQPQHRGWQHGHAEFRSILLEQSCCGRDRRAPWKAACPAFGASYSFAVLLVRAIKKIRNLRRNTGWDGALQFAFKEKLWVMTEKLLGAKYHRRRYTLPTRFSPVPPTLRAGSSDRTVFNQVFVYEGYDLFGPEFAPEFIVDAGANIGFASVYFLSRYPAARVVAIEPDPGNFEMLVQNTSCLGERVLCLNSGLWPFCTGLKVVRGEFADGREWTFQVRPVRSGETPDLDGMDLETVLKKAGFPRVDLLKMDIERSEREVFGHGPLPWLDCVRVIAVELHDSECEKVFWHAIQGRKYTSRHSGETTVVEFRD